MSAPRPISSLRRADATGRRAVARILLAAALGTVAGLVSGGPSPASADASPSTSSPACPTYNTPDELTLVAGTPQTAKLGSAFGSPFQVALANTNGCPVTSTVAGTPITFSAPSSGPSGTFGATGTASVMVGTDATGSASAATFVANDIPGGYTLTASSTFGSVTFSLINTATGIAASLVPLAPLTESAYVGAHYNRPLSVQVLDANGAPVEGANVVFALGSGGAGGGGSAAAATAGASFDGGQAQVTETTSASGIATSPLFSASEVAGSFSASATTAGVTEPATFKLENVAGKPPTPTLIGAAQRSAPLDTRYARPLQVQVTGADGKPMQGVSVTFTLGAAAAGSGGGGAGAASPGASFLDGSGQATEMTGARGRATSPLFRANGTAGTFTASISIGGLTNPLTVALDNLAGRSSTIELVGAKRRSATVEERYHGPLEVKVLDGHGDAVQGASVTFALGSASAAGGGAGGGSAGAGASFLNGSAQATETTAADGLALSPLFTANGAAGTFTATASVAGVTNPVAVTLDNLAAGPPRVALADPAPASAPVGGHYAQPLEVRVTAADGDPVEGTTVTFTLGAGAGAGGASGSASAGASFVGGSAQATATTDADGRASSPAFTANTVAGTFTATASIAGSRITTLTLHNRPGPPLTISAGAASGEQATVGQRFAIGLAVTVSDADKNPVPDTWVTFVAPRSGPSARFRRGGGRERKVRVRTNSDGIAVAPALVANRSAGGYVVKASVAGAGSAAFALVNQPAGRSA